MTRQERAAQIVRDWNARYPVGTRVIVETRETKPREWLTASTAWVLCGTPTVSVSKDDGGGSVSLSLEYVSPAENKEETKEMERTKGRIRVVDGRLLVIDSPREFEREVTIADVLDTTEGLEGSDSEADANAVHLAACWNTCEDFAKPELLGEALCQIDVLLMDLAYIREHGMSQGAWANVTANALNIADFIKAMKGGAA